MNMDTIKEYLISLGFHIDEDSLNNVKQSIADAEGNIKNFANSNIQNMSTMQSFFKLFSSSVKDNLGIVSKITPEAKLPLLQLISLSDLLYKGVTKVTRGLKSNTVQNFTSKVKESESPIIQLIALIKELTLAINNLNSSMNGMKVNIFSSASDPLKQTTNAIVNVKKQSDNAGKSMQEFKLIGGNAVKDFSKVAGVSLKTVAVGFAGVAIAGIATWKSLSGLAKQDLGFQKLAMQLWTTTENAKEVGMALKTMKISMQDLWLSPELLRQFNQLRQDSAELKLSADAEDKLKLVRSITFEFQRLKQAGSLAFQWIGYYIAKYAGGPLANIHEALQSFVNWILKNIPNAAKIIGSVLGVVFRLILTLIEAISIAIQPIVNIIEFIGKQFGKLPEPLRNIIKLFALLGLTIMAGPVGILVALLAILDDVITYMKGGHSVIGEFFDKFSKGAKVIDDIKKKFKDIKDVFLSPIRTIKEGWNNFWESIAEFFDKIWEKFSSLEKKIKNSTLGKILAKLIPNVSEKAQSFSKDVKSSSGKTAISYVSPQTFNSKSTKSNVNNSNSQTNNFYVTGTGNANSTASAVAQKLGLKTRNLGSVIN